jgi:hypothetical protein
MSVAYVRASSDNKADASDAPIPSRRRNAPRHGLRIRHVERGEKSRRMNLDELAAYFCGSFTDPVIHRLAAVLRAWKTDTSTAQDLRETVERYVGNAWIARDDEHKKVYDAWSSFRDSAIGCIRGMTMNERLYSFGLFDRFDASAGQEKLIIYRKLHAEP